jgi:hypothetical protein
MPNAVAGITIWIGQHEPPFLQNAIRALFSCPGTENVKKVRTHRPRLRSAVCLSGVVVTIRCWSTAPAFAF